MFTSHAFASRLGASVVCLSLFAAAPFSLAGEEPRPVSRDPALKLARHSALTELAPSSVVSAQARTELRVVPDFASVTSVSSVPQISSARSSIVGSGRSSIVGSGRASIVGSGRSSIVGSGRSSIVGSGRSSIVGSGR
jgi:hypothetical protein